MKTEQIKIANLKCHGCATTIKNELQKLSSMENVVVDNDNDTVEVMYDENILNRERIIEQLHHLGYPEATEKNGLLLQLKSYGSCMIGRVNNLTK